MSNPLLAFWHWIFEPHDGPYTGEPRDPDAAGAHLEAFHLRAQQSPETTGAIFLVLRRMRAPLIVLVSVFAISVLGLTLIPGSQPDGGTEPMGFFDAFYFMSYTATTIGFGEIPYPLTTPQRVWVTFSIFLSVIGWAYGIGTMLAMLQERGFRREVNASRFRRRLRRMPDPFLILVGFGEAGSRVAQALDIRGRRLVVIDRSQDRIEALELAALRADVPAITANVRVPGSLLAAGLQHPRCEGVLALTDDDEANVGLVQATHLLRPGLPVIARAQTRQTRVRMAHFGEPTVVDPYDAFGDRLRLILRTPALAQLFDWLVSPPGDPVLPRATPPAEGRWVVVGEGRVVAEVAADLMIAGLEVVTLDPAGTRNNPRPEDPGFDELVARAVGLVAATDRDTVNIAYVEAARRANPEMFVVARQESPGNAPVFAALHPNLILVPAEVVAREVIERLANPVLWDFVLAAKGQGDEWASQVLDRLVATCGTGSPTVWQVGIDAYDAPALTRRLGREPVSLGSLMPSPFGRVDRLPLVCLILERDRERLLVPDEDVLLEPGDVLLMAGGPGAQRGWNATLGQTEALGYVLSGSSVAMSWWGRRLLKARQ